MNDLDEYDKRNGEGLRRITTCCLMLLDQGIVDERYIQMYQQAKTNKRYESIVLSGRGTKEEADTLIEVIDKMHRIEKHLQDLKKVQVAQKVNDAADKKGIEKMVLLKYSEEAPRQVKIESLPKLYTKNDWPFYKKMMEFMVINNPNFNGGEKLLFITSTVENDAKKIVQDSIIENIHYIYVWEKLNEVYSKNT